MLTATSTYLGMCLWDYAVNALHVINSSLLTGIHLSDTAVSLLSEKKLLPHFFLLPWWG